MKTSNEGKKGQNPQINTKPVKRKLNWCLVTMALLWEQKLEETCKT